MSPWVEVTPRCLQCDGDLTDQVITYGVWERDVGHAGPFCSTECVQTYMHLRAESDAS